MEEVIEQLRELNEPVPVPLELPDDDLLVEIEEQLLINLPFGLLAWFGLAAFIEETKIDASSGRATIRVSFMRTSCL